MEAYFVISELRTLTWTIGSLSGAYIFRLFISLLVIRADNYSVGVESVSDRRALREKLGV